jgi:hypothetical protein
MRNSLKRLLLAGGQLAMSLSIAAATSLPAVAADQRDTSASQAKKQYAAFIASQPALGAGSAGQGLGWHEAGRQSGSAAIYSNPAALMGGGG